MIKNERIDKIFLEIIKNIKTEDTKDAWSNAKFEEQRHLQIDKRGSVGERFFLKTLQKIYPELRRVSYNDGDQGDWDLKIGRLKFEIKTSSLDVNNKFQNEGLKKEGDYDGVLFLGVAPNDLYMYCIKKSKIDFKKQRIKHSDSEIHLHNRGNDGKDKNATGAGYKCDFKLEQMKKIKKLTDIKEIFEQEFGTNI